MAAYYNENDSFAAAWLRELIKAGHIAPGDVDERDIKEVKAADLKGYVQCHWFAGIGVWSYALRAADWDDDRPAWTGSCPCQPFSASGRGGGFDDDRHLWPVWFELIRACQPSIIFGEQVSSSNVIGKSAKPKAGKRIPASVSSSAPSQRFDSARSPASIQTESAFRSEQTLGRDSNDNRQRSLLDDRTAFQSRGRPDLGQSVTGQNRTGERLPLFEYPSDLPRVEQRDGGLGRTEDAGDRSCDPDQTMRTIESLVESLGQPIEDEDRLTWFNVVSTDLERARYAIGACDIPAAGVGGPHIRQRLFFVAQRLAAGRRASDRLADTVGGGAGDGPGQGMGAQATTDGSDGNLPRQRLWAGFESPPRGLEHRVGARLEGHAGNGDGSDQPGWFGSPPARSVAKTGDARRVADTGSVGRQRRQGLSHGRVDNREDAGWQQGQHGPVGDDQAGADRLADAGQGGRQVVAPSRLHGRSEGESRRESAAREIDRPSGDDAARRGEPDRLADAAGGEAWTGLRDRGQGAERRLLDRDDGADGGLADTGSGLLQEPVGRPDQRDGAGPDGADAGGSAGRPGPLNGHWATADWLLCRDGKWRPVESETFPLASGTTGRVGRLRGYGNSLCSPVAQTFIEAVMDVIDG